MPLFVLGGSSARQIGAIGAALSAHPSLTLRYGAGPATFHRSIEQVVGVRAKDPSRPWDPDPEWVRPFATAQTLRAFPPGADTTVLCDEGATADPSPADLLARRVFVGPAEAQEGLLMLTEDEARTDRGVDRLLQFLEVDDQPAVRAALRAVPKPGPRAAASTERPEWVAALDADEVPPFLSEARRHPDDRVRAALTRWLVRRGLAPEAAELLCGTRLVDWPAR